MTETVPESFVEPVTGVRFAASLTSHGSSAKLTLTGAGVREKKIAFLNLKVYAVALYVEAKVKDALTSWQGQPVADLLKNSSFFKAVLDAPVEKALQLVLVRDISGSQFWGALDEAVRPRLKAAKAGEAGDKALAEFGKVFKSRAVKSGNIVTLTWIHPSTLQVAVAPNASEKAVVEASIDSKAVVAAVFDIYCGDVPVSPAAKSSFVTGLAGLM